MNKNKKTRNHDNILQHNVALWDKQALEEFPCSIPAYKQHVLKISANDSELRHLLQAWKLLRNQKLNTSLFLTIILYNNILI